MVGSFVASQLGPVRGRRSRYPTGPVSRGALLAIIGGLFGCGRWAFDVSDRGLDSGASMDAGSANANRVFMTSASWTGNLGGLAGADAKCQTAADAVGLRGQFMALLWNGTDDPTVRLAGARGWIDLRGRPIADQPSELLGGLRNPIQVDERGLTLSTQEAWLGDLDSTCSDWTDTSAGGVLYDSDCNSSAQTNPYTSCTTTGHLVCVENAQTVVVTPPIAPGRIAFLAENFIPSGGIATADARCAADANGAGLPGTYLAWLGASSGGPETRFVDGLPWRRVDGVLLAATALDFLSTTTPIYLDSILNRTATGAISTQLARTGVSGNTCSNWAGNSMLEGLGIPGSSLRSHFRLSPYIAPCNSPSYAIVCLEQ